ncbi:acyl-CoA dehydrogenase family protein [Nocardioides marmotae]|uniref:acyl-CoA dehydrogenase family protein n=1 Tax=Nocardioides marmotae TaxID=2663857 RepID=UPI0012B5EB85|nr:acyl-CoA dehydrogenase family protein [Nocardioides marmotae]MBC9734440.1 acyl-CoA dehydrogenase family protein [Nocardioides marmotae]MTB85540.1 acyl-CoA dehydrogenase [Nocardioides marmotae]
MPTDELDDFRARARAWLADNLPRLEDAPVPADEDAEWARARELQRRLYDGGFAGICFPVEYGGQGLTLAHQKVFTEESAGYEMPLLFNAPTLGVCAPTILEHGSEEQKRTHISAILRGEAYWVQYLSEPKGGSDLAGLVTRADRVDDGWVINGAKTWSTCAYSADWALCLARTDWDVPKHEGLTMFLVPTDTPGITMRRIRMVNGGDEHCEEFLDDVRVGADAVLGEVNGGWAVAMRQLFHERSTVGGGSPYVSGSGRNRITRPKTDPVLLTRATSRTEDPVAHELLGRWHAREIAQRLLNQRVKDGIASGRLPATAASMMMLAHAEVDAFNDDVCLQLAGAGAAAAASPGDPLRTAAVNYLMRQASSLGGGSAEMSRNMIAERFLGMPREHAPDRGVPFREVSRG